MDDNQVAGQSIINLLTKRGWTSKDNKVFTKDNMTMNKPAGTKFSKWHLNVDGKEVLVEGEANVVIGVAIGLSMAAGNPAPTPKQPKVAKAPVETTKPAVLRLDEVESKPGWTMNDDI